MKKLLLSLLLLVCVSSIGFAQTDTEFWFAAPDLEAGHAQQPIRFCIVSYETAATVVFEQPANNAFSPQTFQLSANDFYVYDVSSIIDMVETKPYNTVVNYGFHITSTTPVSVYYESDNNNSEIYCLKGSNALGTNFVVPMQYLYENYYSNTCSRIEVVATQNNTTVTFVPSVAIKGGGQPGVPVNVTLNRGQSYAIEASNPAGSGHLRNTWVTSNKPIAVNTSDDSVNLNTHQDLIGDQIVPVSLLGTDYFAIWNNTGNEHLFIFPTENNTHVYLNGGNTPVATLNVGQEYTCQITSNVVAIHADKPISVFQMSSSSNYELGGTLLPQINCTGSRKIAYKRQNASDLVITLIVKTADVNGFRLNGDATCITASDFSTIPSNTAYSYCRKNVSAYVPTNGVMKLENIYNDGYFHLGILTGESGTWNYGYFSDYQPYAYAEFEMDENYCAGETIRFSYTAENVNNLVLVLPDGSTMSPPPFVIYNCQTSHSGRYYLQGDGCNGTQILDYIEIHVGESVETNITLQGCNQVSWHGHTFTHSVDSTWTVQGVTQNGCDSIYHLNITVHYDENVTLDPVEACDSYTWHGSTYTQSGFYDYQTTTQYGCQRVEHLPLTIHYSDTVDFNVTACEEYTWHGTTYTESGNHTFNTTNQYGCNRLERLFLTISDSYREVLPVTECDSYFWPMTQQWYYATAMDSIVIEGEHGQCDSTFVLDLTIHYADTIDLEPVTACESYPWYGTTYTESGTYSHPTTNEYGCDRLERLQVTINHDSESEFWVTSCEPYEWFGTTYDQPGDYEHHIPNTAGCDSLIVMHLELGDDYVMDETVTACDSYTWHGTTYTTGGDFDIMVENPDGCDSIFKLHLTLGHTAEREFDKQVCEPMQWYEHWCDHDGDYVHTFTDPAGCDSIVTMHFTIGSEMIIEFDTLACEPFQWHGQYCDENGGTYQFTIPSTLGCDSTMVMHLKLVELQETVETIETCDPYEYGGVVYSEPGEYFLVADTLQSAMGCDSVINVKRLKINPLEEKVEDMGHYSLYVASNYVMGVYTFEIDTTGVVGQVEWSLSNPSWSILEEGQSWCKILVATPGECVLSAKLREECSMIARQFILKAGFFGVDDPLEQSVSLYPNPTDGRLTIEAEGIESVRIVDMMGQTLLNRQFGRTDSVTLQMDGFAPSVYLIDIKSIKGEVKKRVVLCR